MGRLRSKIDGPRIGFESVDDALGEGRGEIEGY
jgi:hypothetical protein